MLQSFNSLSGPDGAEWRQYINVGSTSHFWETQGPVFPSSLPRHVIAYAWALTLCYYNAVFRFQLFSIELGSKRLILVAQ